MSSCAGQPPSLRASHAQPKSRGHAQVLSPRNLGSPGLPCHPGQSLVITTPRLCRGLDGGLPIALPGLTSSSQGRPHGERPGVQPPGGSHQHPSMCWALRAWAWLGFTARPHYHAGGRNSCLQVPTSHATSWSCGLGQMPSPLGTSLPSEMEERHLPSVAMPPTPFPSWGTWGGPCLSTKPRPCISKNLPWAPPAAAPSRPPTGTTLDVVEVESYDPYTDTWTPVSPALKYVSNFSAASCQGRLYLVGSSACKYNALALQCYNPITGWKPSGHMGPRGKTRGHLHRATAPTRLAVRGPGDR